MLLLVVSWQRRKSFKVHARLLENNYKLKYFIATLDSMKFWKECVFFFCAIKCSLDKRAPTCCFLKVFLSGLYLLDNAVLKTPLPGIFEIVVLTV